MTLHQTSAYQKRNLGKSARRIMLMTDGIEEPKSHQSQFSQAVTDYPTMNINNGITQDEIAALLASKNDEAGNHILWVSRDGEIHLDLLQDDLTPSGFAVQNEDRILLRFETFQCGCGYTGSEGASDPEWVGRIFRAMKEYWAKGREEYIDVF